MKRYGHRAAAAVSLLCTMFVGLPVSAHDGKSKKVDAKLYEVTENMTLDDLSMPSLRSATAALQGTAKLGSPLCSVELVQFLVRAGLLTRADKPCTITAVGSDKIDIELEVDEQHRAVLKTPRSLLHLRRRRRRDHARQEIDRKG